MSMPEAKRQGSAAQTYANGRVGKKMPKPGLCLQFARSVFDIPAVYPSAIAAWNGAKVKHTSRPPSGIVVPVFFATPSQYRHVAVLRTDGKVITTNDDRIELWSSIDAVAKGFRGAYMGWSEDLNGYDLYDAPKAPTLKADGWWGTETTKAAQKAYGTTQDGVISGQNKSIRAANPGLVQGWSWQSGSKVTGSLLIAAIQRDLAKSGLYKGKITGVLDSASISALSRRYGVKSPTGTLDGPSDTIKAFQRDLADGKVNGK